MKQKVLKDFYETPLVEVIDIHHEGVICQSNVNECYIENGSLSSFDEEWK